MLMDDALNDPHHFRDFLVEHGVSIEPLRPEAGSRDNDGAFRATRAGISFVNGELSANDAIFPSILIRKGRYPLIRQMRDVHQFDVGSHLALCYLLARRNAPTVVAQRLGCPQAAAHFENYFQGASDAELGIGAIFHDFFKAFRSRRPLPSKLGSAATPSWFLPDGSSPPEQILEEEADIAALLLPIMFELDPTEAERIGRAISGSSRYGSVLYRAMNYDRESAANVVKGSIAGFAEPDQAGAAYLGVVDWLGKGWALDVLTVRKERKISLRDAGTVTMRALDEVLTSA